MEGDPSRNGHGPNSWGQPRAPQPRVRRASWRAGPSRFALLSPIALSNPPPPAPALPALLSPYPLPRARARPALTRPAPPSVGTSLLFAAQIISTPKAPPPSPRPCRSSRRWRSCGSCGWSTPVALPSILSRARSTSPSSPPSLSPSVSLSLPPLSLALWRAARSRSPPAIRSRAPTPLTPRRLCAADPSSPPLRSLCSLSADGVTALAPALAQLTTLKYLDLSCVQGRHPSPPNPLRFPPPPDSIPFPLPNVALGTPCPHSLPEMTGGRRGWVQKGGHAAR
jgi:hypothetical protein